LTIKSINVIIWVLLFFDLYIENSFVCVFMLFGWLKKGGEENERVNRSLAHDYVFYGNSVRFSFFDNAMVQEEKIRPDRFSVYGFVLAHDSNISLDDDVIINRK